MKILWCWWDVSEVGNNGEILIHILNEDQDGTVQCPVTGKVDSLNTDKLFSCHSAAPFRVLLTLDCLVT